MKSNSPPHILAILPGWMPSTLMDVVKPMLALERLGRIRFRVALEPYLLGRALDWADLVIFCRNIEPRFAGVLEKVCERSIPFIYDIDDNLFDVPDEILDGQYYRAPTRIEQLHRYLGAANLVRVYSPVLFQRVKSLTGAVRLVEPPLEWSLVTRLPERCVKPAGRFEGQPVRMVYATSRGDDTLYQIFAPALEKILADYPEQAAITFWGVNPPQFRNRRGVSYHKFMLNYDQFMRRFSRGGFEIGLAPLPDDVFHQSKTNNKYREYGACSIAGIYSRVSVYTGAVADGQTGLLVENEPQSWYAAMQRLIEDPELRWNLGRAARRELQQQYPPEQFEAVWQQQIEAVLAQPAQRPAVVIGTSPAINASARPGNGWSQSYRKLGDELHLLVTQPRLFLTYLRKHLQNLSWLVRLNGLKHL